MPTVPKKPAAKADGRPNTKLPIRQSDVLAALSILILPVQELQVRDLSTLIVGAPLSLLLNKTHTERIQSG